MAVSQTDLDYPNVVAERYEVRRRRGLKSGIQATGVLCQVRAGSLDETKGNLANIPITNRDDPDLETREEEVKC